MGATPGAISINSSLGPNRNGYLKPDLSSSGDFMLSAGRIATMNATIISQPSKIAFDSLHMRNGGTSMASPTVAGMVALYLQQCSKADHQQIKLDLLNSAKKDVFTGSTTNPKWGVGKADAFQFLKRNAFYPSIISSSNIYCLGDSVQLSVANNYANYYWNIGDSSNAIYINNSGIYFAQVENQNHCLASTDTLNITFQAKPSKPNLLLTNDTIIGDKKGIYNWFLNGNQINGIQDSMLTLTQSGNYYAIYLDSTGCSITTDTIPYFITSLEVKKLHSTSIYPNPNSGNFSIHSDELIAEISIRSLSGQLIYKKEVKAKQLLNMQLGPIKKGIYFIEIEYASKKLEFYKLVINS
jgi:hypothetical protein